MAQHSNRHFRLERTNIDPRDSSRKTYLAVLPATTKLQSYLVLFPGFGETANDVLAESNIPVELAKRGCLTIIPTLQDGVMSLGVDSSSQASVNIMLNHAIKKYGLDQLPCFVGGFSIGGSCAILYAENAVNKPAAVFAIDPPLDFENFYYSAKRNVRLSVASPLIEESAYMIERLEKETGGTPANSLAAYYRLSPYSFSDSTQSAIRKIAHLPIRIYTDPDIDWWLKNRQADFAGINAPECSAMINELQLLGNKRASLITAYRKGYRKQRKSRHPHSWNIADGVTLADWLMKNR